MLALTIRRARSEVAATYRSAPTTFAEFLTSENKRYLELNDHEVRRQAEVRDPALVLRLENYRREKMTDAECEAYTMEQMLADILTNVFIRSHFRKDPVRQSLHENAQITWLQRGIPDLVKLPAGKGGTYFYEGRLTTEHPRPAAATKTLDVWSAAERTYGVLKFSTTAGGAQDNQYNDVKHFIREAVRYLTEVGTASEVFIMWLNGPYYTTKKYDALRAMVPADFKERIRIQSV